jgi:ABC-type branched-subunit amino acid transport system substrate-binding protein
MTPGMQFRLWLRQAARGQVGAAFVVFAAVIALVVASVDRPTATQSALTGDLGGTTGAVSATTGAVAGGGSTTGVAPAPGGTTGTSTGTSTGLAGGTSGSTSGGSTSTSGSSTGGTTTGGTTTGGGSTSTGGQQTVNLATKTDRGVNTCGTPALCVKLGIIVAKIGGVDSSGQALGLRTDIEKVVTALIDDQNRRGGLNGRAIVPVFRTTDPVDEGDQGKACTEMTDPKAGVFGVLDTAGFIFAAQQACLTQTNRTPYVHGYAESEGFMDAGSGYDVSETRSLDRIALEWADEIGKLGFLKGGEKVGILEDNCEPSHSVVDKYLVPGIKALKVASVKTYESDCSAAYAQSQPPALEQQMCVDGVTHVVLATSFVAAQTFLQAADGSPCGTGPAKFHYMASDYSLLAGDLFTRNFSKTQFDGSLAITNFYTGIAKGSAQQAACSKVLKAAGLAGLDNTYPNADANALCDYFAIFTKAAVKVGPNLTRPAWAQAVQSLGEFDGAFSPKSVFAPGKTSGGELVHAMVWHADCTCYRQTGPVHPGKG